MQVTLVLRIRHARPLRLAAAIAHGWTRTVTRAHQKTSEDTHNQKVDEYLRMTLALADGRLESFAFPPQLGGIEYQMFR